MNAEATRLQVWIFFFKKKKYLSVSINYHKAP